MYWETDLFKNIGSILNGQMKEIGSLIEGVADKSICVSTTEKTIGWGSLFDNLGAKYLANAQKRYRGKLNLMKFPQRTDALVYKHRKKT